MGTTVKELIEELKKYPEDTRIVTECISNHHSGVWRDFDGVKQGMLNTNENFGLYNGYTKEDIEWIKKDFELENPQFEEVIIFESRV